MIQGLRRSLIIGIPNVTKGLKKNTNVMSFISRSVVDFTAREKGEETTYIRRVENERKKVLQEKMDEILDREHHDEEKQALVKLLDSKEVKVDPREVGTLQYLGFDDWRWAVPSACIVGVPLIMQDVLVIDYKMYLVGVFALMWHTYDAALYPIWAEKSNWVSEYIRDSWALFDKQAMAEINNNIKVDQEVLDAREVMQDVFTSVDQVTVAQATAFNLANQNNFQRALQKKLDALASLNEATSVAIRNDMISTVKSESQKTLLNDRKVKDAALAQAIATLAGGKRGKDVVGEVYLKSIADYRAGLANKDHKVHGITAKLEAEIAEIVKAPEVIQTAGNVYETHPVLR